MLLSIFTPTYNRAHIINRVFQSLCKQKFTDFEWVVVDDGSTDNTELLLHQYKESAPFQIQYIKQKNGGKHVAYNTALAHIQGEYIFTVDSDDWLPEDSLSQIKELIDSIENLSDINICGIIALKENQERCIIGEKFTCEGKILSTVELEHNGNGGERSIVFSSKVAKKYPFPIIHNEKFMGELVVYDRIAKNHKVIVSNKILTTCEYQSTGLSSNFYKLMINNPGGFMIFHAQRIDLSIKFIERLNHILRYNTFKLLFKGMKESIKYSGRYSMLVKVVQPLSHILRYYYLKKSRL